MQYHDKCRKNYRDNFLFIIFVIYNGDINFATYGCVKLGDFFINCRVF